MTASGSSTAKWSLNYWNTMTGTTMTTSEHSTGAINISGEQNAATGFTATCSGSSTLNYVMPDLAYVDSGRIVVTLLSEVRNITIPS